VVVVGGIGSVVELVWIVNCHILGPLACCGHLHHCCWFCHCQCHCCHHEGGQHADAGLQHIEVDALRWECNG